LAADCRTLWQLYLFDLLPAAEHFGNCIYLICCLLPNTLATVIIDVMQKKSCKFCKIKSRQKSKTFGIFKEFKMKKAVSLFIFLLIF